MQISADPNDGLYGGAISADTGTSVVSSPDETTIQRTSRRAAQEEQVRSLLMRANLSRMRGEWDESIALCAEALQKAPESVAAHSLLGDVYESQNRLDEAAQWFRMAVELNPNSKPDQEKLDRVLLQPRAVLAAAPNSAPQGTEERTLQWFDRAFPPGRADSVAKLIFAFCGLIALLLLMGAGFLYLTDRSESDVATAKTMLTPSVTPTAVPATTSVDETLRPPISRLLPKELNLNNIVVDPRTMEAQVEAVLTVDAATDQTTSEMRERILRAATVVAHATARSEERLKKMTVRIALHKTNANESPETVFLGDAQASSVRDIEPSLIPYASQTAIFTSVWWSATLQSTPANRR